MRPLVKPTSSRICAISSHLALRRARGDELGTDVALAQAFLVHEHTVFSVVFSLYNAHQREPKVSGFPLETAGMTLPMTAPNIEGPHPQTNERTLSTNE